MKSESVDAVVVGSGPNGLAAAVTMARAGLSVQVLEAQPTVGGGARTLDLGLAPGLIHDICSAVHPMALASPFLREFDLRSRGVQLKVPEVSYAQPLSDGRAGLAWHDLELTVDGLGVDGSAWRSLMAPLVQHSEVVVALAMGDKRSIPSELLDGVGGIAGALAFARALVEQGTRGWNRRFSDDVAPALLTGVAAHAIAPMPGIAPAGTALLLGALAHAEGWPVPVGGSQAITDALVRDLEANGGQVITDRPVTDYRELPRARAYFLDTTPRAALGIWGERLPREVAKAFATFKYGDAAAKVDFVLNGPVPWLADGVERAGTVHVGGTRAEMVAAEAAVARGEHAERPMVLLSDPAMLDPGRIQDGLRPLWTYAHVPAGSTRDVTEDVTAQIERFAPGFRDVVVTSRCVPAAEMSHHNASYIGGDIASGAVNLYRMVARPRLSWDPYSVGIPGVYLCSASTLPGPGVHGLNGWFAAQRALRARFGMTHMPSLAP